MGSGCVWTEQATCWLRDQGQVTSSLSITSKGLASSRQPITLIMVTTVAMANAYQESTVGLALV